MKFRYVGEEDIPLSSATVIERVQALISEEMLTCLRSPAYTNRLVQNWHSVNIDSFGLRNSGLLTAHISTPWITGYGA